MLNLRLLAIVAGLCATMSGNAVWGQSAADSYPSRPVMVTAAIAPGGPIDLEARVHFKKMTELMGQPFVMDFRPGGGGSIGIAYVVKSTPDGYTLLVQSAGITINPAFYKDLPYDILRDLAPISVISDHSSVFLVRPGFPAKNFTEFLAYARANPGKINYGTTGPGGVSHLGGAWIQRDTNTKVTFVHYKGATPVLIDLQGERLDVATINFISAMPLIRSGKVRALAAMSIKRSKLLPELPTIAEQAIPGFDFSSWLGLFAPSRTPVAVVNKLSEGIARVAKAPDVIAALEREGIDMVGSTPAEFRQILVSDLDRWGKLVKETGIKLDE